MTPNTYTARLKPSFGRTPEEVYATALTDYLAHRKPVAAQVVFYDLLRRLIHANPDIDSGHIDDVVASLAGLEKQKGNGSRLPHMMASFYIRELMQLKEEGIVH